MGTCAGIVEPFKHLLRVTAFPQFLVLELRAPMGTCSGQYGSWTLHISVIRTYPTFSDKDLSHISVIWTYPTFSDKDLPVLKKVMRLKVDGYMNTKQNPFRAHSLFWGFCWKELLSYCTSIYGTMVHCGTQRTQNHRVCHLINLALFSGPT